MPWCVGYLIFRIPIVVTRGESVLVGNICFGRSYFMHTNMHVHVCIYVCTYKVHEYVYIHPFKILFFPLAVHADTDVRNVETRMDSASVAEINRNISQIQMANVCYVVLQHCHLDSISVISKYVCMHNKWTYICTYLCIYYHTCTKYILYTFI